MADVISVSANLAQMGTFATRIHKSKVLETRKDILKECMSLQRSLLDDLERFLPSVMHSEEKIQKYRTLIEAFQEHTAQIYVILNKYPLSKNEKRSQSSQSEVTTPSDSTSPNDGGPDATSETNVAPTKAKKSFSPKKFIMKGIEPWQGVEEARKLRLEIVELQDRVLKESSKTLSDNLLLALSTGLNSLKELKRDVQAEEEKLTRENVMDFQNRLMKIMSDLSHQRLPRASAGLYVEEIRLERFGSDKNESDKSDKSIPGSTSSSTSATLNSPSTPQEQDDSEDPNSPFADPLQVTSLDITELRVIKACA